MHRSAVLALGIALVGGCAQVLGIDHTYERDEAAGAGDASASSASGQGGLPAPPCQGNAACEDQSVCTTDICIEATGMCEHVAVPDGLEPGVTDMPDDCMDRVCKDGVEQVVADDDEVPPDDMNPCSDRMCAGGVVVTNFTPADTVCAQGPGSAELVCDGMGVCVGCTSNSQCPDVPVCQTKSCVQAKCVPQNSQAGAGCGANDVCDGAGNCVDCIDDGDCSAVNSQVCDAASKTCVLSCPDGKKNGAETDLDCGGAVCPDCAYGQICNEAGDCSDNLCQMNLCRPAACANMMKDGSETDVDCGGQVAPTCQKCGIGLSCLVDADCVSNKCSNGPMKCV